MKPCPLVNHRLALRTTQGIPIRLTAERCSPMVFMQHRGQAVSTGGLLFDFQDRHSMLGVRASVQ